MSKLAELQLGGSQLKDISFTKTKRDGTVVTVRVLMQVLTKRDLDLARVDARKTVQRLDKDLADGRAFEELLEDARIVEILARACRNPEKVEEQWATPLDIELTLTTPEIATLWKFYEEHQDACGPIIHDLTTERYETLIEAIVKEGSADPFVFCASPLRNAFVITMARELLSLRMESSSRSSDSTSPSAESSTLDSATTSDASGGRASVSHEDFEALRDLVGDLVVRMHKVEIARDLSE